MKLLCALFISGLVMMGMTPVTSTMTVAGPSIQQEINHGGGCRKNSPPGQCCHMDRSQGVVHCH